MVFTKEFTAIGHKSASVTNGTVSTLDDFSFDQVDLDGADAVIVSCTGQNTMVTFDGTDPTATTGHLLVKDVGPNGWLMLEGPANVRGLKMIAAASTATVFATLLLRA